MKRMVFLDWFLIFIVWAIYRAYFTFPEWFDEFLVKPFVFALPVIYVVIDREKKKWSDLGLSFDKSKFFLDIYIGVVIGVLFALEGLVVNYLKYGQFSFTPILASRMVGGVGMFFLLNFVTSISEEILARGYLYNRLNLATRNQLWSAVASNILFLILHIPIMFTRLHLTGMSLILYPLSIFILGITNCYLFSLRKSLTLPILVHAFWNMTVALYL